MPHLFSPFVLKDVTLKNRIVVSPMCQYSSVDGMANGWHWGHYGALARGGSALVIVEATGVLPEGRITPGCLGIWEDGQVEGLAHIAEAIEAGGAVPGIQIGHAGRKASITRPWEGDCHIADKDPAGWETFAPSALSYGHNMPKMPKAMSLEDIAMVEQAFEDAARRALAAGFKWLELHFAHGFLAQTFFSKSTNLREDAYGGDFEGRIRFLTETLTRVRRVWPEQLPLSIKFGCVEFDETDDETMPEVIALLRRFKALGADLLDASIGFTHFSTEIPWGPGMMVDIAAQMRRETGMPVGVSWGVEAPVLADKIIAEGQADLVYMAKALLANPNYPHQLASKLGVDPGNWILPAPYAHWLQRYSPEG